ncbi:LysM peptidoglycan-binding domain-containing protein [Sporosarcina luteola]|uniref:LysM peptidoglycan-binding domain-containing protein n=1 Tax=Sporosarcina luteola TaxID=582850 RepID=UPI00203F650B|nr:LysM peptidoglycan-binding domain-containing protein [Sporosarcina luteola]MCM3742997.1 LysM peptidoglycan-binding domain-containing protein [Sporosarcina luteola]
MKNNDYKVEFEEHRKEIGIERTDDVVLPSRVDRHKRRRKGKKTSRYTTINLILGIFTFIPILIFVYVIYNFYFGSDSGSAKVESFQTPVEYGTNNSSPVKGDGFGSVVVDPKEEKKDEEQTSGDADKATSTVPKQESEKPPVSVNPPAVEKETPKQPETSKQPVTPKVEEKPKTEKKPEENTKARTHTVAANETLYRISMKYYGSDTGIDKIKKANGLSSNEIMVGQKLIIP